MNRWDGGACWNDSNLSGNVLYDELTGGNNDIEIWMTEYDFGLDGKPYLYDNDPNAGKPYQGTWSHTLHSLYETVSYMTKIPNIKILISNNINGFSGNYRLIDTYAYTDDEDGTNACKFHNEDGISSCFEKCSNEFIRLSPKGEAARLLNQLAWRNENIREINFNNQVNYTTIKRYNTEISWNINDIYGWKFDPEGDYLFINFSENQYEINLEDNNMYHYSIITTDSLFKKNYFHLNPSINYCADTSDSYPNCTIGYDGYYQWEFSSYSTVPNNLDEYFSHSSNITFINGDLESSSMLILPKHSIIQVKKLGNSNCGDGEVELWDTCYDIATTTSIDLSNSNLSGTIPSTIGQLTNLYSLRLQNNELSGEIPSELFDIQGLRYINLSGNSLSGEIPWNICDWIELWPFGWTNDLIIMNNNLCPPYPDCLLDMGNGEMFFDLNYQDTSLCEELSNIDIYPLVYSLSKPYPNPFNPTTTISFSIPSFEFVSIKVYNLKGELISTLIEKNLSPGIYNLIWNAKDCSSGQYFVKMESENYSKTEIVTLVK